MNETEQAAPASRGLTSLFCLAGHKPGVHSKTSGREKNKMADNIWVTSMNAVGTPWAHISQAKANLHIDQPQVQRTRQLRCGVWLRNVAVTVKTC